MGNAPTHADILERVAHVRKLMADERLVAIIVRSTDRFLNEYVPEDESTRQWISGFTGSMGDVVIGRERAWACVDGRYWLQAERELEPKTFAVERVQLGAPIEESVHAVLRAIASAARATPSAPARVGYEPDRYSVSELESMRRALDGHSIELVATRPSLVERVRGDVAPPSRAVRAVDESRVGRTAKEKLAQLWKALEPHKLAALVVPKLDEIAWLTNLRGDDFPYQATFRALAIVRLDEIVLACPPGKIPDELRAARSLRVIGEDAWVNELARIGHGVRVGVDAPSTPAAIADAIKDSGAELVTLASPLPLMKSKKTPGELAVMLDAFARADGVVERAARWLSSAVANGERVTEADFAERVAKLFKKSGATGLSFKVISAAGKNGAVIHYSIPDAERVIEAGELMLLDTGAYYAEGYATDLTRTFLVGDKKQRATDEQRRAFTLVLKAAIAGMSARVPVGTRGDQLDAIVRDPLWRAGLNYNHGTGHGVGINVHEFPPRVGPLGRTTLEAGQVFSIEPGYYHPDFGGVRIENLCTLEEAKGASGFLDVVPLTFSPLDLRLIDMKLLSRDEARWLRAYRARGRATKARASKKSEEPATPSEAH